jgi:uncharacterized membrane protein YhaH (DUF805 family)
MSVPDSSTAPRTPRFDWRWFFLSPEGRIGRFDYWVRFFLVYLAGSFVAAMLDGPEGYPVFGLLWALATLWPGLAVGIKRCHDRDRSGWFLLVGLIPVLGGLWLLVELGFLRGTAGPNRFGPDPLDR